MKGSNGMKTDKVIQGKVQDIKLSDPILYIDNQARGRSGHMGHPMLNLGNGLIMDFNSNVSDIRCDGHSGFGWMEYRLSEDYGETFGNFNTVPYTKKVLLDGLYSAIIETAVVCNDGSIVAFCNIFSQTNEVCCYPFAKPAYIRSVDNGKTWEDAHQLSDFEGRIYSSRYHDGKIYVLEFCNKDVVGEKADDLYRIFTSDDNGKSFRELCVVPFRSTKGRFYGAMQFAPDGDMIVYAYNQDCEEELDYAISSDCGKTWYKTGVCYLSKKIRNPQVNVLDGQFILHGREAGEINAFVLYTSADGITWDEGNRIADRRPGTSFYSNNVIINKNGKDRLLIQYSQTYKQSCCVNIYHRWIESLS